MTSSSSNPRPRRNRNSDATVESQTPDISRAWSSEYRVAHPNWWSTPYISTAISPNGQWLLCATRDEIRLFNLGQLKDGQKLDAYQTISSPSPREADWIQMVAISQSLVAVLTASSLIVYEVSENGIHVTTPAIHDKDISISETWIPHSLSIFEREWIDSKNRSWGWIAVGGQNETAVRIFSLSWGNSWTMNDCAVTLRCAVNMGSIQLVAFSPSLWDDPNHPFVFGVNSSNVIYCWDLRGLDRKRGVDVSWYRGASSALGDSVDPGHVTSVVPFFSSSGCLYIFVTADQVPGSQIGSFIERVGPLKFDNRLYEPCKYLIPEDSIGRNALLGTISPDGLYCIVVEKEDMRVLVLKGVKGGLACFKKSEKWKSPLKESARNISGLSVSVRHEVGQLKIVAADGRGRILKADIRAPTSTNYNNRISRLTSTAYELPGRPCVPELNGDSSGPSGSSSSRSRTLTQVHVAPG